MLQRKKRSLFIIAVWLVNCTALFGQQGFADFFVDFIRYPETQANHVRFPLKADNATIKNKSSFTPVAFATRNNLPVLCSDSLNAIAHQPSPVVSIVQLNKKAVNCFFEQRNKIWNLTSFKNEEIQQLQEADFLNFLMTYSKDEEFQMKHTVFPFPYRTYHAQNRNKEPENNLLMPREWEPLDFTAIFPSLCIFNTDNQAPNRQIHVFINGKATQLFNFIRINKKWYLIEIEEYK